MQYAVHLTVRGRVQAFRVVRKSSWVDQVGSRERKRESIPSLLPIRPPRTAQD